MPIIDVSDILLDPDIAGQQFTVLRRTENVNPFGESTWTTAHIQAIGSVQPSGEQGLIREEGFDAQAKSIKVVTNYRLRGVAKGPSASRFKPDIILWDGNYFEVINLDSYGSFGAGFVEAECTAIHYVDLPPKATTPEVARLDFSQSVNSALAGGGRC
jgi:hypothetical protein